MNATDCTRKCWITGGIIGLLVWICVSGIGSMRWFEGLFLGLVAAALMGAILVWLICSGHPAQDGSDWNPAPSRPAPKEAEAMVTADPVAPEPVAPGASQPPRGAERNDIYSGTAAQPDDLKLIRGVGPKLEEMLHEHGVTRFAQIAEWDDAEMDRFAEIIGRMGGRIRSDDWVGQAQVLARGEETEFSKRVEEGSDHG